jgi:hypothetical protein
MIFSLNGQTFVLGIYRRPLGDSPGFEHPLHLQAKVVVQTSGLVLLDHKDLLTWVLRGASFWGWGGLGLSSDLEVPLLAIAF